MTTPRRAARLAATAAAATVLVAGCGSSSPAAGTENGHPAGAITHTSKPQTMSGMQMGAAAKPVDGIKPIPTQTLGTADWQHMAITARAMTAVPFLVDDGTSERMVKPPRHVSFHLMVTLDDARSHYPIPYASVWATVRKNDKVVFDERQWPMLSEYMGPHYGNNVVLPGAGHYTLTLLVSPPVAARHVEYEHVWTKPHRVSFAFNWKPTG